MLFQLSFAQRTFSNTVSTFTQKVSFISLYDWLKFALVKMKRNRAKKNTESTRKIFHFFNKSNKVSADKVNNSPSEFYNAYLPNINTTDTSQIELTYSIEQSDKTLKSELENQKSQLEEEKIKNELLSKENSKYKRDLTQMRKLYNEVCRTIVKKDLKIKMLEKKFTSPDIIYGKHKDILGQTVLKKLRKLSDGQRSDSTFVYTCLQKIYENDFNRMKNKSVTGSKNTEILTPEKKKIIEDLFLERLMIANLDENVYSQRFGKLHKHLNTSINNIRRFKVN